MLDALDFHAEGAVKCARVGKGKICLSDDINALMNEANVGAEKNVSGRSAMYPKK